MNRAHLLALSLLCLSAGIVIAALLFFGARAVMAFVALLLGLVAIGCVLALDRPEDVGRVTEGTRRRLL
jgi:hypothetical protein